ncbi:DUF3300 domain-containing protein [Lysobacter panacisoli]|uniref:DUF3300 domain-containing protein n=1 Tax=Lysobacter panacisoli TaxID=1255263 RepID=A0ABP9L2S3_9GAMM|nr:DUF3300 domain-containing protein [Lysobacter panacisoli]
MRMLRLCCAVSILLASACSRDTPEPATPAKPPATVPATAPAPAAQAAAQKVFGQEELDQMVAPIALYPDPLLTQVLMAATYPGNVADAVTWAKAHPDSKGDAAVKLVADQPWDPSVQSLVAFPQVLDTLGQDPGWVQRLGDAFLAQPGDVMDAVQRLRRAAQAAGNLQSTPQQTVTVAPAQAAPAPAPVEGSAAPPPPPAGGDTIIEIAPTNPEVVYVPSYNPTTVYGSWPYPSYPPPYYPPSPAWYPGSAIVAGLAFGTGVAVADALWGDWDWHGGDVDIDVNRYNNINTNRQISSDRNVWRHDSNFRGGTPYRDSRSREQFGQQRMPGAENRQAFRGNDAAHEANRERARQEMQRRGFEAPAASNRQAQDRAREAGREARERPGGLDSRPGQGGAGTQAQRDRARDVAQNRTQGQAGQRDRARETAAARTQGQRHDGARAGSGQRTSHANTQAREQARSRHAEQARAQPRSQTHTPRPQQQRAQPRAHDVSRNNAFAGASHPQQARAQANRGQASRQSAQRPQASRSGGHQVQRQSRGGGGHRRG